MASWPTLKEVRSFLRLQPDADQDAVIGTALAAAIAYGDGRLNHRYPPPPDDDGTLPDDAHQACLMDAARLTRRRDSVDGTIGFGDMGAIRVGRADADVERLYDRCGPLVFG
jgi:hypothetical protein